MAIILVIINVGSVLAKNFSNHYIVIVLTSTIPLKIRCVNLKNSHQPLNSQNLKIQKSLPVLLLIKSNKYSIQQYANKKNMKKSQIKIKYCSRL